MADSIRERILQALETQLKTITGANGYENTVLTVDRVRHIFFDDELPAIGIWDDVEETTLRHGKAHQSMTVRLDAHLDAGTLNKSVALNKMRADLKKALQSGDVTFGGISDGLYIGGFEPSYPEDDKGRNVTGSMNVSIVYYETIDDPYLN